MESDRRVWINSEIVGTSDTTFLLFYNRIGYGWLKIYPNPLKNYQKHLILYPINQCFMKIYSAYLIIFGNLMALTGSMMIVYIRFGLKHNLSQHLPLAIGGFVIMLVGIVIRFNGKKKRMLGE